MPEEKRDEVPPVTMGLQLVEADYWMMHDMVDLGIQAVDGKRQELRNILARLQAGEMISSFVEADVQALLIHYGEIRRRAECMRLSLQIQNGQYSRRRPEPATDAA